MTFSTRTFLTLACLVAAALRAPNVSAQQSLQKQVDSLFMIASAGEIKYQKMVEPAIEAIAALGPEVTPILVDKYATKSARERLTIGNILKKIGSPATPYLVKSLKLSDHLIVARVCNSLGEIKDSAAVEALMAVASHSFWPVRDEAVGALGQIGDRAAREVVEGALADTIGQVRKSAAVSAGRLALDTAIPMLVHSLGDDFYGARMSAFESLLKLDTATVMAAVVDSLESENRLVGDLGCEILGSFGGDRAIELLLAQSRSADANRRGIAATAMIQADPLDNCGYRRFLLIDETDRFVILKIRSAILSYGHAE